VIALHISQPAICVTTSASPENLSPASQKHRIVIAIASRIPWFEIVSLHSLAGGVAPTQTSPFYDGAMLGKGSEDPV
jgi:hypothetical protein